MLMIIPVEWRDYNSAKAVSADFDADKDFRVCCPIGEYAKYDGMACNKSDLTGLGIDKVKVRYKKLSEITILEVNDESKIQ